MLFNSFIFWFFFVVVIIFYYNLKHSKQNILLLIASYIFYASWDWRFLSLILFSTFVDFIIGKKIFLSANTHHKKSYLIISIVLNLGILGVFKYFNFFINELSSFIQWLGYTFNPSLIHIVLPVGISFYTFQTMSYTIDIYRGDTKPIKSIINFALYVAYFPQLVAGPIERSYNLLPQILNQRVISISKIQNPAITIIIVSICFSCLTTIIYGT